MFDWSSFLSMFNMKSFFSLLVLAQGALLSVEATGCNADNCARAITGTAKGSAYYTSAKTACSNFMKATVYPATVTRTASRTIFPSTKTSTSTGATVTQTSTVYSFTSTSFITVGTDFKTVTGQTVSV